LSTQETWVPVRFVAADAEQARALLPSLPWLGAELVVVADDGAAWIGPAAFLTCLWATVRYRPWSHRLAGPAFAPLAERFFVLVSSNRRRLASALEGGGGCDDGTCRHQPHRREARAARNGPRPLHPIWAEPRPPGRLR
jgi:hypothetical protein